MAFARKTDSNLCLSSRMSKTSFYFSDAKLLHCCELFVRYYVVFAFLLINIAISIRFTIKGIIYYIITIPHYILCICTSVFSIVCTIIVFIGAFKSTLGINMFIVVTIRIFQSKSKSQYYSANFSISSFDKPVAAMIVSKGTWSESKFFAIIIAFFLSPSSTPSSKLPSSKVFSLLTTSQNLS